MATSGSGTETKPSPGSRIGAALEYLIPALGLIMIGFIAGAWIMDVRVFPAEALRNAFEAGRALFVQQTEYQDPYPAVLYQPERTDAQGVTVHDEARVQPGWTLYTSGHDQVAHLIDLEGRVLQTWDLKFSSVWNDTAVIQSPQPDDRIYYRRAELLPDGNLVVVFIAFGDTPWGYGIARMNPDSEPVWAFLEQAHHDLAVEPDGTTWALTHAVNHDEIEGHRSMRPPRIDDYIVELAPDGTKRREIRLVDAFAASDYAGMLNFVPWYNEGDYFHTNSIDIIEPAAAEAISGVRSRQLLISVRELGLIALLDIEEEIITWALRGSWQGQHDPDLLPSGDILLFDNFGHYGPGGRSRVIEFDPYTMEIVWRYTGTEQEPLFSGLRSAQQRLANGNTLITESDAGRLLEVGRDGTIVWEFINPVRSGPDNDLIPVVSWGLRIDPGALDPEFRRRIEAAGG